MSEQLVIVTWLDAWCDASETEPQQWLAECPVETLGWLVRETRRVVSVAAERFRDGRYRGVTHIPRSLVRSITPLRAPK